MYFPILINWTSLFPILGLMGSIFHFYSNFDRNICKQTVENLIRRRVLRRLIGCCTVCRCHIKRTLGLYGLRVDLFVEGLDHNGETIPIADHVSLPTPIFARPDVTSSRSLAFRPLHYG